MAVIKQSVPVATWAKEGAWDPKVPGSNPGTRGRLTSIKTEPDAPRSEGKWAGAIHGPCLLAHAHNDENEGTHVPLRCHYKYQYMGKIHEAHPPMEWPRRETN